MNLVVVQVAMYLERMAEGVAAEALQAAIWDSQVSSYPVQIVAEQVQGSVRLPGVAPCPWTGSAVVVQCSRFLQMYNQFAPVTLAILLVTHSSHRRREARAVK